MESVSGVLMYTVTKQKFWVLLLANSGQWSLKLSDNLQQSQSPLAIHSSSWHWFADILQVEWSIGAWPSLPLSILVGWLEVPAPDSTIL
jgi:hypothetical protein